MPCDPHEVKNGGSMESHRKTTWYERYGIAPFSFCALFFLMSSVLLCTSCLSSLSFCRCSLARSFWIASVSWRQLSGLFCFMRERCFFLVPLSDLVAGSGVHSVPSAYSLQMVTQSVAKMASSLTLVRSVDQRRAGVTSLCALT